MPTLNERLPFKINRCQILIFSGIIGVILLTLVAIVIALIVKPLWPISAVLAIDPLLVLTLRWMIIHWFTTPEQKAFILEQTRVKNTKLTIRTTRCEAGIDFNGGDTQGCVGAP